MFKSIFACIGFLTIIPFNSDYKVRFKSLAKWFTLTGLIIGSIIAVADLFMIKAGGNVYVTSFIDVVLLTMLTRGFHLDGLSDTFDAFFSVKNREDRLKIMKDPHIGAMGVISLIIILLGKFIFISNIPFSLRFVSLIYFPVFGRLSMNFSIYFFKSAKEDGLGSMFINKSMFDLIISLIIPVLLWGIVGIGYTSILLASAFIISIVFGIYCIKMIGGLTGDTLGAVCEITEFLVLLIINFM